MYKEEFMREAIKEAKKACRRGEVPVGAVIVYDNEIIARSGNERIRKNKTTSHCEIEVIEKANRYFNSWRLEGCDLYVTLEPCPMCAGAIMQARIKNVYFGAYDKKAGAYGSTFDLNEVKNLNYHPDVYGGLLEEECSNILSEFFKEVRLKNK